MSVHSLFLQTGISVCCINKRERLKYERNKRASVLSGELSPGRMWCVLGLFVEVL